VVGATVEARPDQSRDAADPGVQWKTVAVKWFTMIALDRGAGRTPTQGDNLIKQDPAIVAS
jgi:hypothetical protein